MAAREWTCKEASTAVQSKIPILKQEFEGHEREIWSFVFLHDNIHIVSGSVDGTMRKWNCNTGLVVGEPWKGEEGRIHALVLSPDGMIIVCGRMDGSIQRWTTDGKRIKGAWTGHSKWVRSLSWSPSGSHFASGSDDGTILIRTADNGKVVVGPIDTKQSSVSSLAYSPSGERIASGGHNKTICIWNTKTGKLVIGPMEGLEHHVTSLAWSSDGTKVYSASDEFARVFDSTSGALLHSFKHDSCLYSVALSPKDNVLACVGINGVAQLWDIESNQQLGEPIHQNHRDDTLYCVSFSRDGRYLAYGGDNNKLTLWIVKDTVLRLPAPTPPEQSDGQSTQQETPNSPSSCLDVDATGGAGFIEEAQGDLDNNFFHLPQEFLPSPSPGLHFHSFLLARRFLNVISRRRPPSDESVPQERSKHSFFSRRARSNSFVQLAAIKPNQLVPEGKVTEGERGKSVDDCDSANDSLSARKDRVIRRPTAHLDREDHRNRWTRLLQSRGKDHTSGFLHSSTAGSSRYPVDVFPAREDDRYGIVPETDAEAAAAMLRTNDDVTNSSTQPGQSTVVAQGSQRRPTQTQASTSGPQEIETLAGDALSTSNE